MADNVFRNPTFADVGERFNLQKVSWGAIWAGTMVTLGLETLFLLFGIFIGAVIGGSAIWTMAWYLVTMGVSFGIGALCASHLSDVSSREIGGMHGLATWGLATSATVLLAVFAASALIRFYAITPAPISTFWSNFTEQWGGLIWGGVMLSLLTAFAGGVSGFPAVPGASQQRVSQQVPIERRA